MGFDHCGIFYPLQTFNKDRELSFTEIPMLIEANNTRFQEFLVQTAERISEKVRIVHSDDRKQIHLAAVFACNFANCLWGIADEIMTERDLSFDLLRPLLFETLQKALDNKPHDVQTGPAQRGDAKTIEAHMNKLSNEQQKEIYQLMTKYIIDKKNLHG